jgi:hypothetical protein
MLGGIVKFEVKDNKNKRYKISFELFYNELSKKPDIKCKIVESPELTVVGCIEYRLKDFLNKRDPYVDVSCSKDVFTLFKSSPKDLRNASDRRKILWFVSNPLKFFEKKVKNFVGMSLLYINTLGIEAKIDSEYFSEKDLLRFCKNLKVFFLTKFIRKYLNDKAKLSDKKFEKETMKDFIEVARPLLKKDVFKKGVLEILGRAIEKLKKGKGSLIFSILGEDITGKDDINLYINVEELLNYKRGVFDCMVDGLRLFIMDLFSKYFKEVVLKGSYTNYKRFNSLFEFNLDYRWGRSITSVDVVFRKKSPYLSAFTSLLNKFKRIMNKYNIPNNVAFSEGITLNDFINYLKKYSRSRKFTGIRILLGR